MREDTPTPYAVCPLQPAYGAAPYPPPPDYRGYRAPSAAAPYEGVAIRFVTILLNTIIIGIISSILTAPFFAFSLRV